MNIILGILIGLIILMLLIVVHEFGHYIMARRSGIEVEEFAIGFPPSALKWQKLKGKWTRIPKKDWDKIDESSGMVFSINFIPIGGFCKMKGESDDDKRKGSFGKASLWGKTKTLFGGVAFNLLFATILFTVLAWAGMPIFLEDQFQVSSDSRLGAVGNVIVSTVIEDSPASTAGIVPGSEIISIAGEPITAPEMIAEVANSHTNESVPITYITEGKETTETVTLAEPTEDRPWVLGVSSGQVRRYYSTWSAPIVGIGTTVQLTGETFKGVGSLIWNFVSGVFRQFSPDGSTREQGREAIGTAGDGLTGPVGIVGMIFPAFVDSGATNIAFLAGVISISLACMNALPIPALDGGRWLIIMIYRLRNKQLKKETEERIVGRAFMVLIGLIVLITVLDITRFF